MKASDIEISDASEQEKGITASTENAIAAGNIFLDTDTLTIRDSGRILSNSLTRSGDAGNIEIRASQSVSLLDGGRIGVSSIRGGSAGSVTIVAPSLVLQNGTIASDASSVGQAGMIRIDAGPAGSVSIESTARRMAAVSTTTRGAGRGGAIQLTTGTLSIAGAGSRISSSAEAGGDAGSVDVAAGRVEVRDGGRIASDTLKGGDAGNVSVAAPVIALLDGHVSSASAAGSGGRAGMVQLTAAPPAGGPGGSVQVSAGGSVTTSTAGTGMGGVVAIRSDTLSVTGDGTRIASDTSGRGPAGAVRVVADDVLVGQGASISSATSSESANAGAGGEVTVAAGRSLIVDGGQITSSSTGTGAGGNIVVDSPGAVVVLKGVDAPNAAGRLAGAGEITASAEGSGAAGEVTVLARDLLAKDGAIRTRSTGAEGGQITVRASERIYLRESVIAADGKVSRAGTAVMTIQAPAIVLSDSQMTSLTEGLVREGSGEVKVTGDDFTVVSANSTIRGSTETLISGLQTNLGSDLQLSPGIFLDTNSLLQPSCADRGAARSTFTRSGRGGVPAAPDRPLPSAGADAAGVGRVAAGGTVFLDACAGSLVPETNS